MKIIRSKSFANGTVYALRTDDDFPVEVTDTFLPFYTKDAIGRHQNSMTDSNFGDRSERWMIGVSVSSGCPVGCLFCSTGKLRRTRMLSCEEMLDQINFVLYQNKNFNFSSSKESKINWTRMGDAFLNIKEVKKAIFNISNKFPNVHNYVSTVGIKNSDFSWIKGNISLQISLHSLNEDYRNKLIPFKNKMSIKELSEIRTESNLKTTLNLTLVNCKDWDIRKLYDYFDPNYFFIKLSPINVNETSTHNNMGNGVVEGFNLR